MSGILRPDAIAKGVEHRPQGRVGAMSVISVEPLHHVLEQGWTPGRSCRKYRVVIGASPCIFGETNERRRQCLGCTLVPNLRTLGAARRLVLGQWLWLLADHLGGWLVSTEAEEHRMPHLPSR